MLHKIQSFFYSSIHQLKFFFILLVLPCMVIQCNIDDLNPDNGNGNKEKLPPATQSGKGTFGCKVNGEVWVPESPPNSYEIHADYYEDEFFVSTNKEIRDLGIDQGITLRIDSGWKGTGIYKLKDKNTNKNYGIFIGGCNYFTDTINGGELKVTHFDSSKRIASGRFHFTVVKKGCDTIRVTKGRFDIQD